MMRSRLEALRPVTRPGRKPASVCLPSIQSRGSISLNRRWPNLAVTSWATLMLAGPSGRSRGNDR